MLSKKPYLIPALLDWICDSGGTPHIKVDTNYEGVIVPIEHILPNGNIVLNIAANAVANFYISDTSPIEMRFNATFSGKDFSIRVPLQAIDAIFMKENNQGMVFVSKEPEEPEPPKKAHLELVK